MDRSPGDAPLQFQARQLWERSEVFCSRRSGPTWQWPALFSTPCSSAHSGTKRTGLEIWRLIDLQLGVTMIASLDMHRLYTVHIVHAQCLITYQQNMYEYDMTCYIISYILLSTLSYLILFYPVLSYAVLFYAILFHSILVYSILFYSNSISNYYSYSNYF